MIALAEAFLPGCTAEQATDVAAFIEGQIAALPPRLLTMFHLGMTFFRTVVHLRYLRSFCALSREKRQSIVDAWAFGRIALLRQLFRPVRSLAVLAYYERPEVIATLAPPDESERPKLAVVAQ
jgi:hypothetical protein